MEHIKEDIAVCILFFEKLKLTKKCIRSFIPSGVNIYILNNNSSAKSSEKLTRYCSKYKQIKLFFSSQNLGPAGGRNYLIENTNESWLIFVDNDINVISKDWVSRLKNHFTNFKNELIFIPKLYNYHEEEFASFHSFELNNRLVKDTKPDQNMVNCFPGGASIINRDVFNQHGLYNEKLFAFEDYEYAIRCLTSNNPLKAILVNDIVFEHRHVYHHKKEDKQAVFERYNNSRLIDAIKIIEETHKVELQHYWQWWVDRQVFLMTKATPAKKLKNFLNSFLRKNHDRK